MSNNFEMIHYFYSFASSYCHASYIFYKTQPVDSVYAFPVWLSLSLFYICMRLSTSKFPFIYIWFYCVWSEHSYWLFPLTPIGHIPKVLTLKLEYSTCRFSANYDIFLRDLQRAIINWNKMRKLVNDHKWVPSCCQVFLVVKQLYKLLMSVCMYVWVYECMNVTDTYRNFLILTHYT